MDKQAIVSTNGRRDEVDVKVPGEIERSIDLRGGGGAGPSSYPRRHHE